MASLQCALCGGPSMRRPELRIPECECQAQKKGFSFKDVTLFVYCIRCKRKHSVECLDALAQALDTIISDIEATPYLSLHDPERVWATLRARPWAADGRLVESPDFIEHTAKSPAKLACCIMCERGDLPEPVQRVPDALKARAA